MGNAMTKQPWGPWQDCVQGNYCPSGELLIEYENGKTIYFENVWVLFLWPKVSVRYAQRLPEPVRTVDFWLMGAKDKDLDVFKYRPRYDDAKCVRLTLTGEIGTGEFKTEWV